MAQTDGQDLPAAPEIQPTHDDLTPFLRLLDYASAQGISVAQNVDDMAAEGDTNRKMIRLSARLAGNPGALAATLAHELTHCLLHCDGPLNLDLGRPTERALCELEAEAVAYVVAHTYGFTATDKMADYMISWHADGARLESSLHRIHAATRTLLAVLEAETERESVAA